MTEPSEDDGTRPAGGFLPPEIYYARLASAYVTAGAREVRREETKVPVFQSPA